MIYKEIKKKKKQVDPEKFNMRISSDNLIALIYAPINLPARFPCEYSHWFVDGYPVYKPAAA